MSVVPCISGTMYKVSCSLKLGGGGGLIFEIWTKRGVMKKMLEIEELVERGHSLRKGGFQIVLSVFL